MVDFGELKDKAQNLVAEHSDQVKQGIEKVGDFVGNKLGHDKVDPIEDKLASFVDGLGGPKAAEQPVTPPAPPVVPPPTPSAAPVVPSPPPAPSAPAE